MSKIAVLAGDGIGPEVMNGSSKSAKCLLLLTSSTFPLTFNRF